MMTKSELRKRNRDKVYRWRARRFAEGWEIYNVVVPADVHTLLKAYKAKLMEERKRHYRDEL